MAWACRIEPCGPTSSGFTTSTVCIAAQRWLPLSFRDMHSQGSLKSPTIAMV